MDFDRLGAEALYFDEPVDPLAQSGEAVVTPRARRDMPSFGNGARATRGKRTAGSTAWARAA